MIMSRARVILAVVIGTSSLPPWKRHCTTNKLWLEKCDWLLLLVLRSAPATDTKDAKDVKTPWISSQPVMPKVPAIANNIRSDSVEAANDAGHTNNTTSPVPTSRYSQQKASKHQWNKTCRIQCTLNGSYRSYMRWAEYGMRYVAPPPFRGTGSTKED
ncbi:MAG: hypothetical protein J3Q66DRAFT_156365 [Benniella sp.]|nr:MAG: hypothetical protein J3Q66DRAFT_156365 [Benniella sp.]